MILRCTESFCLENEDKEILLDIKYGTTWLVDQLPGTPEGKTHLECLDDDPDVLWVDVDDAMIDAAFEEIEE